jgi:GntR family transcriptional regulator / MocR family aminotransferase
MKKPGRSDLAALSVERKSDVPLSRQIYHEIARAILARRLACGARLPSTRALSAELGVSRNTVTAAYEQLSAEGYIESTVGAGTRVARVLPLETLGASHFRETKGKDLHLSRRGGEIVRHTQACDLVEGYSPQIGTPDLNHFPMRIWKHLIAQQCERLARSEFGYASSLGFGPLRDEIAKHLAQTRGIAVSRERVVVLSGAQQALDLIARLLLDPGESILFEDPGYPGARAAFLAAGVNVVPVGVDDDGMKVSSPSSKLQAARAAYVTPAHQFPLGTTMSLSRRLALLDWARAVKGFVVEDDYDGDFRYSGQPLSAIASLDSDRVLYIGTFSKVMLPALRLGFLVLPQHIVRQFTSARGFVDRHSPILEQATLAAFMEQGHFARHIRRMRKLYLKKRSVLIKALKTHAADLLDVEAPDTGMHVIARLHRLPDRRAANAVARNSLILMPISYYYAQQHRRGTGLIISFANATLNDIENAVCQIAASLRALK